MLSADSVVTFNEVMYHPADSDTAGEWIELYNQMNVDVDLSGWSLDGVGGGTFPAGTVIRGKGYLVVAADPAALWAATGYADALGGFTGSLANGGERLVLRDNNLRLLDEVEFGDREPWPVAADGSGASLAKLDSMTPSAPGENWRASPWIGGTPGQVNFSADDVDFLITPRLTARLAEPAGGLYISEVAAAGTQPFWFELANEGEETIDLQGYTAVASNGGQEYVFPAGSIKPGDCLAIDMLPGEFAPAAGDRVYVYAPGKLALADAARVENRLRGKLPGAREGAWLYPSGSTTRSNLHSRPEHCLRPASTW